MLNISPSQILTCDRIKSGTESLNRNSSGDTRIAFSRMYQSIPPETTLNKKGVECGLIHNYKILVEPITPGDTSKSLRGAHAFSQTQDFLE
jgi:hypothetical protein